MQIAIATFLIATLVQCHFDLEDHQKRIKKGKENLEKFNSDEKYNSPCWNKALSKLENGCRKMTDTEQSLLALQFANCHLERSGLDTYECDIKTFKLCTREMAKNIIAFQTYTEFFTHVNDICFYLQSEIWREKTELTIDKLSKTSSESLEIISKSMQQQKEVLSAQEESLKNQRDILHNEKLLSETLVNSAESARDVFLEVREHANEQKAIFSETFQHLFDSVEKLSNLQKMLLGEFIGLQSFAFYFIASIVCYLFTSTPRTAGARLPLFCTLLLLIISERISVSIWIKRNGGENKEINSEDIHAMIWNIRRVFLLLDTIIVMYYMLRFKDYTRVNNAILQQIQDQIIEIKKLQETNTCLSPFPLSMKGNFDEKTLCGSDSGIDITDQLEMSILKHESSTPEKKNKSPFTYSQRGEVEQNLGAKKTKLEKYKEVNKKGTKTQNPRNKTSYDSTSDITCETSTLSESRYNLRSRRTFEMTSADLSLSTLPVNKSKVEMKGNERGKKASKKGRKPAFFSSDSDED